MQSELMSKKITITLADRSEHSFPSGTTPLAIFEKLRPNGRQKGPPLAVKINGQLSDLLAPLKEDAELEFVAFDSSEGREVFRHSSAHIMAQAVKELFPRAKLAIGPALEEGFYYDFAFDRPFTPEDLENIEKRMDQIIRTDQPFIRKELPKKEAIEFFKSQGEPYKVEIIQELVDSQFSLYQQANFIDLCRGPHVPSTGYIRAIKLLSSSGAYWRGDERNAMLQRIYGTAFPTKEELEAHLRKLEEVKRRDHRKLGRELDLFSITDAAGPGLVLWHPKGALIRKIIEDFWREEHLKHGYELVSTPHIARLDLWRRSGHLDFYKENMYAPMKIEDTEYELKPMNCPFHILIYKSQLRSYRDLPFRWAELGTVYRYERSGVLHGLLRVRGFTQDDAHIFCRPDQLEEEIRKVIDFTLFVLQTFGFKDYEIYLSTRPEKFVGSLENWDKATAALEAGLKNRGLPYQIDPGEGVFYGPKIDIKIKDVLGRAWQCTTIQVDFNLPERFALTFIGEDSKEHAPIMIHRALLGSLERFLGVLIEQHAGAFPVWLAPVQAKVIPIAEAQHAYAQEVVGRLADANIRTEGDFRNEKLGFKIREAQLAKIPYMLVLGKREAASKTIAVRKRTGEDLGEKSLEQVLELIQEEVRTHRN
jgi:threonyl-tRNA synthetase